MPASSLGGQPVTRKCQAKPPLPLGQPLPNTPRIGGPRLTRLKPVELPCIVVKNIIFVAEVWASVVCGDVAHYGVAGGPIFYRYSVLSVLLGDIPYQEVVTIVPRQFKATAPIAARTVPDQLIVTPINTKAIVERIIPVVLGDILLERIAVANH